MADVFDQADMLATREAASRVAQIQNKPVIPFKGVCLYCEEPIKQGRYCGSECRDEHEDLIKKSNKRR